MIVAGHAEDQRSDCTTKWLSTKITMFRMDRMLSLSIAKVSFVTTAWVSKMLPEASFVALRQLAWRLAEPMGQTAKCGGLTALRTTLNGVNCKNVS